ncbi:MAG: hypothetical protein ACRC0R_07065, partial [Cetobacterium sp.]
LEWKTIKLTMSAATQRDILYTYNFAKELNPDLKNVMLGIDIVTFFQKSDFQKIEFDKSFYVKNRDANLKYLMNIRTLKYSLKFIKLKLKNPEEIKKMYKLGYKYEYKKENILNLLKDNGKKEKNYKNQELDNEVLENMKENYKLNLKNILENNKDKTFYFFFPPYSVHYYDELIKNESIDEYKKFKEYLIQDLLKYKNINIYDFQEINSIITNLDNYGDLMHFSPEVSQEILEYMIQGKYKLNSNSEVQ